MFAVFDVFASYSNALQASLARVQDLSLVVTMHKFTALKINDITADIFNIYFGTQKSHKNKRDYLPTQEVLDYPLEYASILC